MSKRPKIEITGNAQPAGEPAAEWVDTASLVPWDRNPRRNDENVARVAKSIKRFGFASPIIARTADRTIIAGHTRWKAAQSLGLERVPVRFLDLDPADAQLLALADNRLNELSPWDDAQLQRILGEHGLEDVELAGWSSEDLERMASELLSSVDDNQIDLSADEISEPPANPITKRGDVWLLGSHRLMCGDSTIARDVKKLMNGSHADMVLSDPPYGVSYVGKTKDALKVENDELDEASLTRLVCDAFDNAQSICRDGAYWYATVPAGPLHILFAEDWKRRGILRQIMVWAKDSLVLGHSEYHYQHEPILFGWMPGPRHKNSDRTRTTLWQYDRPKANREHPTMKPVELWIQAIEDGSRQGETVYDPFLGSGTTVIAAQKTGRNCYGMEISPAYCDVIVRRWEMLTGKTAALEENADAV